MTIYFVRAGDTGNIKVGYTAGEVKKRIAQLQTGNIFDLELIGTIPGSMDDERSIHKEFAAWALRGEWFTADASLIFAINKMIDHQAWYFAGLSLYSVCFKRSGSRHFLLKMMLPLRMQVIPS